MTATRRLERSDLQALIEKLQIVTTTTGPTAVQLKDGDFAVVDVALRILRDSRQLEAGAAVPKGAERAAAVAKQGFLQTVEGHAGAALYETVDTTHKTKGAAHKATKTEQAIEKALLENADLMVQLAALSGQELTAEEIGDGSVFLKAAGIDTHLAEELSARSGPLGVLQYSRYLLSGVAKRTPDDYRIFGVRHIELIERAFDQTAAVGHARHQALTKEMKAGYSPREPTSTGLALEHDADPVEGMLRLYYGMVQVHQLGLGGSDPERAERRFFEGMERMVAAAKAPGADPRQIDLASEILADPRMSEIMKASARKRYGPDLEGHLHRIGTLLTFALEHRLSAGHPAAAAEPAAAEPAAAEPAAAEPAEERKAAVTAPPPASGSDWNYALRSAASAAYDAPLTGRVRQQLTEQIRRAQPEQLRELRDEVAGHVRTANRRDPGSAFAARLRKLEQMLTAAIEG